MSGEPGIVLSQIGFSYEGREHSPLFWDFSLTLQRGLVTVILGPSGVGKSTLLGLIAGTQKASQGSVVFCNHEQSAVRPTIGLVFQSATLIPWRTVLSNALFGVEIKHGKNRESALTHARSLLARFGLKDFERKFPFELSGGMQQRVSIIRALVSEAEVLLLDEPFSNSDFLARRALQLEISRKVETEQIVTVLVTHDLNDALRFGDRILVVANRPVQIVDSFEIELSREERLGDESTAALKPYFERVWRNWASSDSEARANA